MTQEPSSKSQKELAPAHRAGSDMQNQAVVSFLKERLNLRNKATSTPWISTFFPLHSARRVECMLLFLATNTLFVSERSVCFGGGANIRETNHERGLQKL